MDPNSPAVKRATILSRIATVNRYIRLAEQQLQNFDPLGDSYKIIKQQINDLDMERQILLRGKLPCHEGE